MNQYNQKPLWQLILIYLVIGSIAYVGVYYYFFRPKTTTASQSTPPSQAQNTIILTDNGFSPSTITVKAGSVVTWQNKSGQDATVSSNPHPAHTDYPPLNLGRFAPGSQLQLTFDQPGTHGYHNHLNPSQGGTIIVQ